MRGPRFVCGVVLAMWGWSVLPVLGAVGDIRNVGHLGGGLTIAAEALNDSGDAVGQSAPTDGSFRAYVSRPDGTIIDIGTLGGFDSKALDISNAGVIVGYAGTPGANNWHAFRYDGIGPMQDLGTLGGGTSIAYGLNESGEIVGWSRIGDIFGRYHAFRYLGNGPAQSLGTLLPNGVSTATAVNDAGVIVGGASAGGGVQHIFRYSGDGPMEDLGMLADSFGSAARDVNEAGEIAGIAMMHPTAVGNNHAIRRRLDGAVIDLGTLGGDISEANAIHDTGVIVGTAEIAMWDRRAALWRADDSIVNLDAWLDAVNPTEGAKWFLTDAFDINIHGQICGRGFYDDGPGGLDDGQTGFVLDAGSFIPEPAAMLAFMAVAATAVCSRTARRRH